MEALDAYRTQARYNTWFNAKLFAVCAGLTDEERRRELGAFFGSIHRTLNHLILCDHVWLMRCVPGLSVAVPRDAMGNVLQPSGLDSVLYDEFGLLRSRRIALDAAIERWVAGLGASDLDVEVSYKNSQGRPFRHPMWWAVTHLFNHQTHHRGQVTTMLFQLGRDPGVTDLLQMMRE